MELCKTCKKVVSYRDNKYCEDTGKLLPIDDVDCGYEEDRKEFDIPTGVEING